jgi:hypothetical protein
VAGYTKAEVARTARFEVFDGAAEKVKAAAPKPAAKDNPLADLAALYGTTTVADTLAAFVAATRGEV